MVTGKRPRLIFGYLFLLGVVAVGVILGCVYWLTGRLDDLERKSGESIVDLLVTETVQRVKVSTADYAFWDLAYEVVTDRNAAEVLAHIGTGATESDLFDRIVILDAAGDVQHVYGEGLAAGAEDRFDVAEIAPFLARLRETDPSDYVTVSGIGRIGETYGAIAASWITPDNISSLGAARLPVMLGIKLFTDDALQSIGRLTRGTGYAITPVGETAGESAVDLVGPDGTPVARLVWSHQNIGTVLRKEIMPGLLLVCFGIFAICIFAARYFHLQSRALETARVVASTDRLTGLLNRSGLDEMLGTASARARIGAGQVAVIYLDLNDFKKLNDRHGHEQGDHALKVTAERLTANVRPQDHVVRLGGDEFICVIFDDVPGAAAKAVSDRIVIACNAPIGFGDFEAILAPSVGVSVAEPGMSWDAVLSCADQAMYEAKRNKRSTALFAGKCGKRRSGSGTADSSRAA
ncbi:diguanylate cyclase domain-containing protein [Hoeflea sp.]|uniref:GGDEF domain-containing protein n=1 Tax=Hoeflea sp. TaxID=1940281 RepID=UPI003B51C33F